jgi:hypothetical protein
MPRERKHADHAARQAAYRQRQAAAHDARLKELQATVKRQAAEIARLQTSRDVSPPASKQAQAPKPPVDPDSQGAFDAAVAAAVKKHTRKLDAEFKDRMQDLEALVKRQATSIKRLQAGGGQSRLAPFWQISETQWKQILMRLHPDHGGTSELTRVWMKLKDVLVKREQPGGKPKSSPLPSGDELQARAAARWAKK